MDDMTKMEFNKVDQQLHVLKTMIEVQHLRNEGIYAVLRKLIEANPGAVHVDEIEKILEETQGAGTHFRGAEQRRGDINEFLRDVGLVKRV